MLVCVTGATGFLGGHVSAELARAGHRVRVTYRDKSRLPRLGDVADETRKADLLDPRSLRNAFKGVDAVFCTAGVVGSSERAWQVNARGPRLVVEAAAAAGVPRVVHTSSVVAVGPSAPGELAREDDIYRGAQLGLAYVESKREGEAKAIAAALRAGQQIVVVNPAYVLGAPLDRSARPESSSRQMLAFLSGQMAVVVAGATNIVDVRDVARGHLLALERGRPGERYILGGHNLTWSEFVQETQRVSGVGRPVLMLPGELARLAHVQELLGLPGFLTGGLLTRLAAPNWQYSSDKAQRELGYSARPLEDTLLDALEWYRELRATGAVGRASTAGSYALAVAQRAGVLAALRVAGRLSGRDLVVGD